MKIECIPCGGLAWPVAVVDETAGASDEIAAPRSAAASSHDDGGECSFACTASPGLGSDIVWWLLGNMAIFAEEEEMKDAPLDFCLRDFVLFTRRASAQKRELYCKKGFIEQVLKNF